MNGCPQTVIQGYPMFAMPSPTLPRLAWTSLAEPSPAGAYLAAPRLL
jgi:hypothetical protein